MGVRLARRLGKECGYVPRQEQPQYFAGGKIVHVDRVEWLVEKDPSTAAAALQTGEVDWVELPLIDLLPMLKGSAGVQVATFDPLGWLGVLAFNHLYPPFDNPKLLRALLPAIDQKEYVQALVGEQMDLGRYPAGFFTARFADGQHRRAGRAVGPARHRQGPAVGKKAAIRARRSC